MKSLMESSLRVKLFLGGASLVCFFVIFNVISTYFFLIPFSAKASVNRMKVLADDISQRSNNHEDDVEGYIEELASDYSVKITIVDNDENLLFSTRKMNDDKKALGLKTSEYFQSNKDNLQIGDCIGVTNKNDSNLSDAIRCIVIKKMDDKQYVVLTKTLRSLQNTEKVVLLFDIIVAMITLTIGFIIIFNVGNLIVRPINEMTTIAEHISMLQFDKRVQVGSKDEIGRLGNAINQMSVRLEDDIDRMQKDIEYRKILVRNLSHEIKSPVAVIMGYADRMNKLIDTNPEKAMEYSKIISNESTRIDVLVREMLNFSRMEQELDEIEYEKITLNPMLSELIIQLKEECFEKNIDFELECAENVILTANRELLKRAIYNLGNNAIKYGIGDPVKIIIKAIKENDVCEITVYNTGNNIPDEEIQYIWNPFYKVDKARGRNQKGYGIGLSIVYEIIEKHKGTCEVKNEENGVAFILRLPLNQ